MVVTSWSRPNLKYFIYPDVPGAVYNKLIQGFDELTKYTNLNIQQSKTLLGVDIAAKMEPQLAPNILATGSYPPFGRLRFNPKYLRDFANGRNDDTVLHEIGHVMGLPHSWEPEFNLKGHPSSRRYTVMSYTDRREAETFQALDIDLLREEYGTRKANTRNDTYVAKDLIGHLIVDDGGFDTLDTTGLSPEFAKEIETKVKAHDGSSHTLIQNPSNPKEWISLLDTTSIESVIPNQAIGEQGIAKGVTHKPVFIPFDNEYDNPVVITGPITTNGGQHAQAAILSIESEGFYAYIDEPSYLDDWHLPEDFAWMVVEQGDWVTESGISISSRTISLDKTNRDQKVEQKVNGINFIQDQSVKPKDLYLTVHSDKDGTTRAFTEEIARNRQIDISKETFGYIEINRYGSLEANHKGHEGTPFNEPVLAASMTTRGADPFVLRQNTDGYLFTQEDKSADWETNHDFESVGYLMNDIF